ncbi:2-C-methyl-D-erythritol 4-phosphate cytidylyltransferase [Microbacterium sp. YY-01]|uniref:2-C-methyl-D-erythritol 4-phosphate cytidylyltransferase n=1 Tax=Microbacterium sp. YY-01 TaxID=3421634 RepID=UPI003D182207
MTENASLSRAIIIVAAGSGTRLGAGQPKALVRIDTHSIVQHALRGAVQARPSHVIIVAPPGYEEAMHTEIAALSAGTDHPVRIVAGGDTRPRSVQAGLHALPPEVRTVLIHDAARALTPPEQINAVAETVEATNDGVIPTLPVVDTLQQISGEYVRGPIDRETLVAAQTPQGFPRHQLERAYANAAEQQREYTDDAAVYAASGGTVRHIPGSPRAMKITTPDDLHRARHLLASTGAAAVIPRVGIGTDVHAFEPGEPSPAHPLRLACLEWPGEPALSGHSDGDAVAHAIVDALLSAAGLGDIGEHFGTAHPEYAGAHGDVFLQRTHRLVTEAGFTIGNIAVQFQSNRPRFSRRRHEAEAALSAALEGASVTVSATTTDGLGFTGRAQGISVTAIALLYRADT